MSMSEAGRPLVDGRFRLVSPLGSGGMGTVWRARDTALDREVALKEVRPPDPAAEAARPGLTAQFRARAIREARALARLSNPHVVTIHHIVEPPDGSPPWIVMELVAGHSVYDRLATGPMPVPEVIRLGREVLSALAAAHSAGIQHRDVKPANVLLRPDGRAVLTDFGIAVLDESTSRLTSTGDLIGSPEFIAPERVRGEEGNPASDLWSLGMLLYVAAEGHHPLRRATSLATVVAVLDDPIPPPVRSGALAPVLTRLLVRDPAARPDAAALDRLLAEAALRETGGDPGTVPLTSGTPPRPQDAPGHGTPPRPQDTPGHTTSPAYTHPAYTPPPGGGWTPGGDPAAATPPHGVFGPPPADRAARPRRRAPLWAGLGLLAGAAVLAGVYLLPPDGTGDRPTGSGKTTATGSADRGARDGGGQTDPTGTGRTRPADEPSTAGSPAGRGTADTEGSLLTPAGIRTVLKAFGQASGSDQLIGVTVYPEYALARIPTKTGARTYDNYEFRDGTARRIGPGGTATASGASGPSFDPGELAWDRLPALLERAERDLAVDDPNTRYVIVDRWTFNDDQPSLRVYLSNAYGSAGYLLADSAGKVLKTFPAT
ncbi:serine/threonine-protein kinase [Streptomyces sp. NPDC047097]|uniref:serine/threonine-protein kinase n=1 Tax=Streptomyces sp. NPDC047097 TaxID=3155260 RepID=UPI0033DDDD6A